MLLALRDCDTADIRKRANGKKKVYEVIKKFDHAWEKLKKVYRKTRFISYPDNYVRDRYFHLASKSEDLTWMVDIDNKFHKLVKEWLLFSKGILDSRSGMDGCRIK